MASRANHFYWRAGFGPAPDYLHTSRTFDPHTFFSAWWQLSSKAPLPLIASKNAVDGLANGIGNFGRIEATANEQKEKRQQMQRQLASTRTGAGGR